MAGGTLVQRGGSGGEFVPVVGVCPRAGWGGCQPGGNRTLRVWGCLGGRMCECCNLLLPGHALCA